MLKLLFLLLITPILLGKSIKSIIKPSCFESAGIYFSLGFIVMVAEFALVCYPATYVDIPFHIVCHIIGIIYVVECLTIICWLYLTKQINPKSFFNKKALTSWLRSPSFWIMVIICGFQIIRLLMSGPAEMRDSKTYSALIVDVLQSNQLFRIKPENGFPIASILDMDLKYSLSPWYPFIAMLAKFSVLHPLIITNTILPPYLLFLHYIMIYSLGILLFDRVKKIAFLFTALCAFIYEISLYCHTPTMIKLVWPVWGKGVLSMLTVPAILILYILLVSEPSKAQWKRFLPILFLIVVAGCSMSTMAALVLPLELGLLGVIWTVRNRSAGYLCGSIISSVPAVLYIAMYYYFSYLQNLR